MVKQLLVNSMKINLLILVLIFGCACSNSKNQSIADKYYTIPVTVLCNGDVDTSIKYLLKYNKTSCNKYQDSVDGIFKQENSVLGELSEPETGIYRIEDRDVSVDYTINVLPDNLVTDNIYYKFLTKQF